MVKVEAIAVDIDGTITDEKRRLCHSSLDEDFVIVPWMLLEKLKMQEFL